MLLSVSAIPAQRWLEPSTFMLSKSICLNYRRSDESPVVPQQAGGLSPALHLNWSTRVVCRDGGRGKRREGDGGRIDGWSRETPTFSSVSSAEAHPTVSLRGTEAAGNLQETGDQFGSFLSGIKKKVDQRSEEQTNKSWTGVWITAHPRAAVVWISQQRVAK